MAGFGRDEEADLALFAHAVRRPDEEIDLAQVALLLAEPEYPGLDLCAYLEQIDELGLMGRDRIAARTPQRAALALTSMLYTDLGFYGNQEDYYDPRNSFLNEVLDRRTGIPITLGLLFTEVATRAGLEAHGVAFPGHFLVRVEVPEGLVLIDPFAGTLLDEAGLRSLFERVGGRGRPFDPILLAPARKRQILLRMLGNLRSIYDRRGDLERVRSMLERMALIDPSDARLARELADVRERCAKRERLLH